MGFWVTELATGKVMDYSPDGSIQYDPRYFLTRPDLDLPPGDQPQQYQWDGAKIVKLPPLQEEQDRSLLVTAMNDLLADATIPQKIRTFIAALKKRV